MTTPAPEQQYHPWTTYIHAREEARRRGDRKVGTEHLLLGLLCEPSVESVLGITLDAAREALDSLDREALDWLGVGTTLDAPPVAMREIPAIPTLKAVLSDRLPLTPAAKRVLQEAGKPMRRGRHITPQQVLFNLLDLRSPDTSAVLLSALDLDRATIRAQLVDSSTGVR